jgi:hypothetical protein
MQSSNSIKFLGTIKMTVLASSVTDPVRAFPATLRIQQLCPSVGKACGVGNFSSNLEIAMRDIGVDVRTISSLKDITTGDLLIQHEFALFNSWSLKFALRSHVGRKFLFAHSPGTGVFSEDVDGFVSLCEGMIDADNPQMVLPHPGWQKPLLDRSKLKETFGWSAYDCVIGTNGFISRSRQFDQIVMRLIDFAVDNNVLIFVACPRHGSHDRRPGYRVQDEFLQSLSQSFPKHLHLEQRFLDQESLNERLQACDLLWCWTSGHSLPYGSGTCSDQYGSGTRLVATNKRQHSQVFGLPNVVLGATDLDDFVMTLKTELLAKHFERHDPSPLSWKNFSIALRDFLVSVPQSTPRVGVRSTGMGNYSTIDDVCRLKSAKYSLAEELTVDNASDAAESFVNSIGLFPNSFSGRGIVICAGGVTYYTCAWVLIRLLRSLGCILPIEVWSYQSEYDAEWKELVEPYQVIVRFVADHSNARPTRRDGWRLKSTAILGSTFREILFLDADNVPTRDPSYLFDCPQYRSTGTVFWPDKARSNPDSEQWKVFGVAYHDEPEQESGQLLVNKQIAWTSINLCDWYNVHSEFFYRYTYGDKETFRFAWHRSNVKFAMPNKGVKVKQHVLLQHDFKGKVLFQHRFGDKWSLARNRKIAGFIHEPDCLQFIQELREQWHPSNRARILNQLEPTANMEIENRTYNCARLGYTSWIIRLDAMGAINTGSTQGIEAWWIRCGQLILGSVNGAPRYFLDKQSDGSWQGAGPNQTQLKLTLQDDLPNDPFPH